MCVGKGFGIQREKQGVDKGFSQAIFLAFFLKSVSWVIFFICVLCPRGFFTCVLHDSKSHPGAQWLRYHLHCLQASWGTKVELLMLPGVRVDHTFSSQNNSFLHTLTSKLINYYLKLKFSTF